MLHRPHPLHSWAHPDFAALRLIPDGLAVRFGLGAVSGSVLSLYLPSPHALHTLCHPETRVLCGPKDPCNLLRTSEDPGSYAQIARTFDAPICPC